MINADKLNFAFMGDFPTNSRLILALTEQQKDIMGLVLAYGNPAARICYELCNEIPEKEGCVYLRSIELTAANSQNAEKILTVLSGLTGAENPQEFVLSGMERFNRERYCKKIQLDCFAETAGLRKLIIDENIASSINEITVCFAANKLLRRELHEISENRHTPISGLKIRFVGDLVLMNRMSEFDTAGTIGKIHFAMKQSDAVLIIEENFRFNERQLDVLRQYLKVLPGFAFKTESDLLNEKFEDVTDEEEIRSRYLITAAKGRIKCPGTERLFEELYVTPPIQPENKSSLWGVYSYGATLGDNSDRHELFNCLAAASFGDMIDKLTLFYAGDLSGSAAALMENCGKYSGRLFRVPDDSRLTPEQLLDFLQSDRPVLSQNGGIAIKSHGKLKFPESCLLAENACGFFEKLIFSAELSEQQRKLLKIKLLHCADAYSMPDGSVIIRRDILQNAAEYVRKSAGEAAVSFAKGLVDSFMS